MGNESSSNGPADCCTTRDNNTRSARKGAVAKRQAGQSPEKRHSPHRDENPCDAAECGFGESLACVQDRSLDPEELREAFFNLKALKPKLVQLQTFETEVETLVQVRAQIAKRLSENEVKPAAVLISLDGGTNHVLAAELIRRLRLHEASLAGAPEKLVTKACLHVLIGDESDDMVEKPVIIETVKEQYAAILRSVDKLVEDRIEFLNSELSDLDAEVGDIEDDIVMCYEKMDEEDTGSINEERFVAFVCYPNPQDSDEPLFMGQDAVNPQDAEKLFVQMSHGKQEMNFEEFKDELTVGCLQVLRTNIESRREASKKYRDTWF